MHYIKIMIFKAYGMFEVHKLSQPVFMYKFYNKVIAVVLIFSFFL